MARAKRKLGEMLVAAGALKAAELEQSILACAAAGMKLGEYLCGRGLIREDQLVGLFRPMDGGLSAWGGTEYVLRPDKRRGGGPRRPAFASGEIKNGARNGKFRAPILNLSAPIVSRRT